MFRVLNPFQVKVPFPYSLKTSQTRGFLMFSGGTEIENRLEMDLIAVLNISEVVVYKFCT